MRQDNHSAANKQKAGYISAKSAFAVLRIPFVSQERESPLSGVSIEEINYKNIKLLRNFVSTTGRILSRKINSIPVKQQKLLAREIKKARFLGLLNYCEHN